MSSLVREEFKELIKNNEYNNISIRIINDSKKSGLNNVVDRNQNRNKNKNISINIPNNYLNNYNLQNKTISQVSIKTIPNNYNRQNKIILGTAKNSALINKISASNLRKISKQLKGISHYGSSSNVKRGENKNHHSIYISKKEDSSLLDKNKSENNNVYTQIMPVNRLTSHNTNILYKKQKEPERRKSSLIYSINNITQNINNRNIINNYIFDSNTYRNTNVKTPNINYYNDYMTYNINNTINNNTNNINKNYVIQKSGDDFNNGNNKIYYNNTLTTINEIKKGNVISHRLNRKDLVNIRNSKNLPSSNYLKEDNIYNNKKNKSFISEIPKAKFSRYDSKDKILSRIVPKINIDISKIKYVRENQSFKNIIRVNSSSRKNLQDNNNNKNETNYRQPSNISLKYIESFEKNKNKNDIFKNVISQKYQKNLELKDNGDKLRTFLYKQNIKDLINKSMDSKDIQRPRYYRNINNINRNIHIIKEFSQKKDKNKENDIYTNDGIKEEEKEESFHKNEEDSKNDNNNNENKRDMLLDNNRIIIKNKLSQEKNKNKLPHYDSKTFNTKKEEPSNEVRKLIKRKKQKNLLKLQKVPKKEATEEKKEEPKDNNYNNIYYTINTEEKIPTESEAIKTLNSLDENDSNSLATEKIKSVIMGTNYNMLKKKARLTLTTKKDLAKIFNTETSDSNTISQINTKHINYKGVKYRLVSSLSVKDQLRKYILSRNKNLDKSINKYQYNDDDEKSISHLTHTAKKEKTINNYTYLELKDIKNIKRDTFITLHSIGGVRDDSRFEDFDQSSTIINLKEKEFKPFVSTHPGKKFKKRGLHKFRGKSERKIRGIKIVGNSDSIEYYQNDKLNFSAIKKSKFFGKSPKDIFFETKREKDKEKVIEESNE